MFDLHTVSKGHSVARMKSLFMIKLSAGPAGPGQEAVIKAFSIFMGKVAVGGEVTELVHLVLRAAGGGGQARAA